MSIHMCVYMASHIVYTQLRPFESRADLFLSVSEILISVFAVVLSYFAEEQGQDLSTG